MPVAAPFIIEAIKDIILPALGVVSAVVLGWVLTTPTGWVTWKRIVSWADEQLKKPVEWALNGIKNGLHDVAEEWDNFRVGLKAYIQDTYDYIWNMYHRAVDYANKYITPRINALETWAQSNLDYLRTTFNQRLDALRVNFFKDIEWINNRISDVTLNTNKRITDLFTYTGKELANITSTVTEWYKDISQRVYTVERTLTGKIELTQDVLKQRIDDTTKELIKKIAAVETGIMAYIAGIENTITQHSEDVEDLENLDIDLLLLAYLAIMKPVIIDRADDLINTISETHKQVIRLGK